MLISGIQNLKFSTPQIDQMNNRKDYSRNKLFIPQNDTFQKSIQTPAKQNISFTSITTSSLIKTVKEFKALPGNRIIHCFYCQRPLLSPSFTDDLAKRGLFEGSIADFVNELAPYESYLKPTSYEIFKYFKKVAKDAPQTHISRALKIMNEEALNTLREKQLPIFRKIELETSKLDKEKRKEVMEVLKRHKNRLLGTPQVEEFSPKDFAYKIKKISKTVSNNIHHSNLSRFADLINETIPKGNQNPYSNNLINRTFQNKENFNSRLPINTKSIQLYLVEQIKKIGTKIGRNDIIIICKQAEDTLIGKPVALKFSNKTLRHDIEKIIQSDVNEKQKKRIFKAIDRLPTSTTNVNSFIAKHEHSNSTTIGIELLKPSVVTLEHMQPESTRQPYVNTLGNYALACGPCNNNRLDSDMAKYLKNHPDTSPQVYFNDIIGVVNDGFISLEDLLRMKETIYTQSGKKMNITNISNKVLIDNFGGENGQENFDHFVSLANNYLISGKDIYALQQMLRQRCGIAVKFNNLKYIFY